MVLQQALFQNDLPQELVYIVVVISLDAGAIYYIASMEETAAAVFLPMGPPPRDFRTFIHVYVSSLGST